MSAGKKSQARLTAKTADPHVLYEKSVQDPDHEVSLFTRIYKRKRKRAPRILREDFCGTALLCSRWVKKHRENEAIGVDIDQPTLDWGIEHHITPLGKAADRVTLLNKNVLKVRKPEADILAALNFSYFVFKTRDEMKKYFRVVKSSIKEDGLFILDIVGGPDCQGEEEEHREYHGYTYVWRQSKFDPITHHCMYHIDFHFHDGTKIRPAYTYDWRLWTIPELTDILNEVGFKTVDIYWEGTDEDGDGNGIYRKVKKAEADDCFVSYLVASLD